MKKQPNKASHDFDSLICIGRVGKARGLAGEFFVSERSMPLSNDTKSVYISLDSKQIPQCYKIKRHHWNGERLSLVIDGVLSRTHVEEMRGQMLWIDRRELKFDENQHYLWHDLVNLMVYDREGQQLGRVTSVENYGAQDNLIVASEHAGILLLPLVDDFINICELGSQQSEIRLKVSRDYFDGLWSPGKAE